MKINVGLLEDLMIDLFVDNTCPPRVEVCYYNHLSIQEYLPHVDLNNPQLLRIWGMGPHQ